MGARGGQKVIAAVSTKLFQFFREQAEQKARTQASQQRSHSASSKAHASSVFMPRKAWTQLDVLKSMEDKGYSKNRLPGAYVAGDLSELRKTIMLCPKCKHGFDWKRHGYYNVSLYEQLNATGRCDKCKEEGPKLTFYIHESNVGLCWMTRDRYRASRLGASIV